MLPPFTVSALFTHWVADPLGIVLSVVLTAWYAAGLVAARRRGERPSWLRALAYFVGGVGSLVLATTGGLAAYRGSLFWVAAAQATVISAVTPVGLALGDPVGLVEQAWGAERARGVRRALRSRVARVLMFPLFSSVLAVFSLLLFVVTPWLVVSVEHGWVRELTYLGLLVTGMLFVLPLLGEELLPAWCTDPVRTLLAFGDGLLDALPGIVLMTRSRVMWPDYPGFAHRTPGQLSPLWDQRIGGGAMLGIAEVIGLPILAAVIVAWVRSDDAAAREIDAQLDLQEAQRRTAAPAGEPQEQRDRPWWETDPRFTDGFR